MKRIISSFTGFTRTERMGIAGLLLLSILLIIIRASMHWWIPDTSAYAEKVSFSSLQPQKQVADTFKINLNIADSLTLIALPGIGKGLSHRILERRRQLGTFTDMKQVFSVYHFNDETKNMLQKRTFIAIPTPEKH